ncbi:hypothetical protein DPMN_124772 [Dreissena polymorpha]|uniref:Uncharacterized protein n=1 Tax=Dreissena polymorpha TaxID=45954 RepID=A0A9D4JWI0_DREPO|nr:hypothetical protein DPMN_124772 [Dreissena polymorpha]
MQKLPEANLDKDDDIAMSLLKTANHIAKRELPKDEIKKDMVKYASVLGVNLTKTESHVNYCSHQSVTELQSALVEVILDDKIQTIRASEVYSLTLDESTENGNLKTYIVRAVCQRTWIGILFPFEQANQRGFC